MKCPPGFKALMTSNYPTFLEVSDSMGTQLLEGSDVTFVYIKMAIRVNNVCLFTLCLYSLFELSMIYLEHKS